MNTYLKINCSTFLLCVLFVNVCHAIQQDKCIGYEPSIVTLYGYLSTVEYFGQPNFGENPETDRRIEVPVLILDEPINICGVVDAELNTESFVGVREIQLIFSPGQSKHKYFLSKVVKVSGTLSQAVSGHHFTEVVMTVNDICAPD